MVIGAHICVSSSTSSPCNTMMFDALDAPYVAVTHSSCVWVLSTLTVAMAVPGSGSATVDVSAVPSSTLPWVIVTIALGTTVDRTMVYAHRSHGHNAGVPVTVVVAVMASWVAGTAVAGGATYSPSASVALASDENVPNAWTRIQVPCLR